MIRDHLKPNLFRETRLEVKKGPLVLKRFHYGFWVEFKCVAETMQKSPRSLLTMYVFICKMLFKVL